MTAPAGATALKKNPPGKGGLQNRTLRDGYRRVSSPVVAGKVVGELVGVNVVDGVNLQSLAGEFVEHIVGVGGVQFDLATVVFAATLEVRI